jgi:acetyl-CoA acetyltransferase
MGYAQRRAAIVGVYTTEQARFMDRTGISLQLEAIKGALDDAGLTPAAVDGLIPLDQAPWYALWAQRYVHEFKVTSEDLAGGRSMYCTVNFL